METVTQILRAHAELAVFLTLALGFLIGRIHIGNFKVGPMLGCLFAGMIIGQMDIPVPPVVKIIFFDLFLFATGYKVGPQFFYGLKKDALPQLALTVIICTACLLTAYFTALIMGYDVGTAAGLLAGAFSESTVIGTAGDAIQKLSIPDAEKLQLINAIPVAYAVTYLVGTTSLVWFLSSMAPKILRIDLGAESRKLTEKFLGGARPGSGMNTAYREWVLRAIQVSGKPWAGMSVADIEKSLPGKRIIIERIRKDGSVMDPEDHTIIDDGDVVVVAARQRVMVEDLSGIGAEVDDRELLDFPMTTMDIVITEKGIAGKSLVEVAETHADGIMLNKLLRGGQEMPFEPGTILHNGDILTISGRQSDVEKTSRQLGFRELATNNTDIIFVSLGIVLGGLIGLLTLDISGIMITLSTSGGALVMGLIFGWVHSKTPAYGKIPEAALWIFDTMGLAVFLAVVGLGAGPTVIDGIQKTGFGIILAGLVVSLLPHVIGLLAGKYLLRMNPVILLGAQSGAGTTTTGLKAVQDAAQSKLPVLGYTIPYALGNILLTAWGPVLVSMMT
ncbi:MAG: aspartate-alanine antiporter [Chitinophagaceae bacterium]|nr:aspartate-alanine antiporter [Chitinophagaceae bacterium]